MSSTFNPPTNKAIDIPAQGTWPKTHHQFDEASVWAIRTALHAGRPLLLRGEPGIGKSQIARAAAKELGVPFLCQVVDERTERDELLYHYDAISRLAEAQVSGHLAAQNPESWRDNLAERRFVRPGVLWWALNWMLAAEQADRYDTASRRKCQRPAVEWTPGKNDLCGPVVLVDEIDKADPSLPNGLLESMGNHGFHSALLGETIGLAAYKDANGTPWNAKPPLVIITTNEERELPAAFLRRCLVHQLHFPVSKEKAVEFLTGRARVHHVSTQDISDEVLNEAASLLWDDRETALKAGQPCPGAAEYLDLIQALVGMHKGDQASQRKALARIKEFAFDKGLRNPAAPAGTSASTKIG